MTPTMMIKLSGAKISCQQGGHSTEAASSATLTHDTADTPSRGQQWNSSETHLAVIGERFMCR